MAKTIVIRDVMQKPYIAMMKIMLRGADLMVWQITRVKMISVKKDVRTMTRVSPSSSNSLTF